MGICNQVSLIIETNSDDPLQIKQILDEFHKQESKDEDFVYSGWGKYLPKMTPVMTYGNKGTILYLGGIWDGFDPEGYEEVSDQTHKLLYYLWNPDLKIMFPWYKPTILFIPEQGKGFLHIYEIGEESDRGQSFSFIYKKLSFKNIRVTTVMLPEVISKY